MAEKYFPFDSVAGDRNYYAEDFAKYYSKILSSGILPETGNLNVTPVGTQSNPSMNIKVSPGFAFLNGHMYELTSSLTLAVDPGESNKRIDRVVVRLNYNDRLISTLVIKGTPAASPAAPAIVRNSNYWDISLATIPVAANAISLGDVIQDTRYDATVCGIVRCPIEKINAEEVWQNVQTEFNTWLTQKNQEIAALDTVNIDNRLTTLEDEVAEISSATGGSGAAYGLCGTNANVAAKVVQSPGFVLTAGARISVYFDVTNTATNATMNVNSTGAKSIKTGTGSEAIKSYTWPAASLVDFVYDGQYWVIAGPITGTWTPIVTFGTTAATSYAVRVARYYKIGNIVTLMWKIRVTASAAGEITISGFSQTCGNASTMHAGGGTMTPVPSSKCFIGYQTTDSNSIKIMVQGVTDSLNYATNAEAVSGETYFLYGTLSYIVE